MGILTGSARTEGWRKRRGVEEKRWWWWRRREMRLVVVTFAREIRGAGFPACSSRPLPCEPKSTKRSTWLRDNTVCSHIHTHTLSCPQVEDLHYIKGKMRHKTVKEQNGNCVYIRPAVCCFRPPGCEIKPLPANSSFVGLMRFRLT